MTMQATRDYSLGGEAERAAIEAGLAEAEWYRTAIDPGRLRELSARSDLPALVHVGTWLALLFASGVALYSSLWSWWTVPAAVVYGVLYGSSADPRWHECGHRTAFATPWLNDLVYYPASFMLLRDPTIWRWSHVRHHSDTIVVARDPEIILERPPDLGTWLLNVCNLVAGPAAMARTVRHAFGRISDADRSYLPERDVPRVRWEARVYVAAWCGVIGWCVASASLVPLLFVVGPSFYGAWLMVVLGATQHLGLREDVLDHRLNTRTMYLNPVLRFLYWNMNYHTEHHMFPSVPSNNLAALHEEVKHDLPEPTPSLMAACREVAPALLAQRNDPAHQIARSVPSPTTSPLDERGQSPVDVRLSARRSDGGTLDLGDADALSDAVADGEVRRLDVEDRTFAVYRIGHRFFATDGICTHSRRQHLAEGVVIDGQIECPKHLGRFDIATGEPTREPVCEALATHDVRIVDGRLVIVADAGQ